MRKTKKPGKKKLLFSKEKVRELRAATPDDLEQAVGGIGCLCDTTFCTMMTRSP